MKNAVAVVLVLLAAAAAVEAQVDARMLRFPDVSHDRIAFVYAGDIWVAPKEGGTAVRLSTPEGEESFPRFSPDGGRIAFTANYDGNEDIYVVPTAGGVPRRLTHHPDGDRMLDWYPDGRSILLASGMASGKQRFRQLYRLAAEGGLPAKLPVPYGEFGTLSPDGRMLAYTPLSRDFRTWKRYRGGMAPDIWLFDLDSRTSRRLTDDPANDGQPMWHGDTVYFLSDRDESMRSNLWAHDLSTDELRQVTRFEDFDVRFPSIGPGEIVFENGGRLYLLELATETTREVEIDVVTDRATLLPRAEMVGDEIEWGDVSPSGKRAVFEARGEVFTVPAEHGVTRNLTRSSGVAERYPAWSPDGTTVAYFSDRSGEYELVVRPADGSGEERTVTDIGKGFRYPPVWSPDGSRVAFIDSTLTVRMVDVADGTAVEVDSTWWMNHPSLERFHLAWSPDSRWLAYSKVVETQLDAVFLYDTASGELERVTSGFYDASQPVFDPDGKYLYYLSAQHFDALYGPFDNTWVYANPTVVMAVPLRADVPSPLAPRNDEEGAEDGGDGSGDGDGQDADDEDADGADEQAPPVEIDRDGFERRAVRLPVDPGRYTDLAAVSGKVLYRRLPNTGADGEKTPLAFWDLEEREERQILADVDGYRLSADGEHLLAASGGSWAIVDVAADQSLEEPLDLGGLETTVDPPAEWRQIFREAWRLQRDYFYDPNLHGVDWQAVGDRYAALLDDVVTRWDLNFLLGELIGELNASHAYRGGGDLEQAPRRSVGLLGVDWELAEGAYRVARIARGAPWDSEVRSALDQPGVDVSEGDWVLAVNGVPVDPSKDPWAAFQGLAGQTVVLTVNDRPSTDGAREVLVETLDDEARLRNLEWIESKRRMVEEATGGRVGYVYVPSTGIDGQDELFRMYRAQLHKDGVIIDERFNNGGQIPDRFIELLAREPLNYWAVRGPRDWQSPPVAHAGPQAMLINGWSGSGGDLFPWYFRQAGLGPLIGTRTWGGLIGISGVPPLVDGGVVTVPTFAFYTTDGEWAVEGVGVAPDIEVVDDPAQMVDGGDPQLERAIEWIIGQLEAGSPEPPARPEYDRR